MTLFLSKSSIIFVFRTEKLFPRCL